uniref:Inhibitor of growth protein N-terminal histone-binding domain-containing protein n=1 Tax=Panagrolaimus sp. ES5 TaxID=591445 RepID=A0AC34FNJ4_9BILA
MAADLEKVISLINNSDGIDPDLKNTIIFSFEKLYSEIQLLKEEKICMERSYMEKLNVSYEKQTDIYEKLVEAQEKIIKQNDHQHDENPVDATFNENLDFSAAPIDQFRPSSYSVQPFQDPKYFRQDASETDKPETRRRNRAGKRTTMKTKNVNRPVIHINIDQSQKIQMVNAQNYDRQNYILASESNEPETRPNGAGNFTAKNTKNVNKPVVNINIDQNQRIQIKNH